MLLHALEPPHSRRWLIGVVAAVLLAAAVSGLVTFRRTTAPRETVRLALLPFRSSPDTADLAAGLFRDTAVQLAPLKGNSQTKAVFIRGSDVVSKKVDTAAKARSVFSATHVFQVTIEKENGNDILRAYLTDARSGVNTKESEMRYQPEQLRYAPVALAGIVTSSLRLPPIGPQATVNAAARREYLTGLSGVMGNIRPDESMAMLQRAVAADPDSPLTWAGLAEAQWLKFVLTGETIWKERAHESVRQAELRNPDLPEVHLISGWSKKDSSQYELAEMDLLRVIDLQPGNGDAWRRLGMTYESSGLLSEALTALKKATQVRPDDFRNHRELGTFHLERSRYSDAQAEYQKMVNLAPNLSASHYALGLAFFNLRKYTEAESEFRAAIRTGTAPISSWPSRRLQPSFRIRGKIGRRPKSI
jgi:tetratricopeptide (TPR) repeat protein